MNNNNNNKDFYWRECLLDVHLSSIRICLLQFVHVLAVRVLPTTTLYDNESKQLGFQGEG